MSSYQCWANIDNGWVMVGDEDNPMVLAQALRDDLEEHGISAEVRLAR